MNKIILIYTTFSNLSQAKKIINILLAQDLIVCANIFASKSVYKWEDKIKQYNEQVAVLKTLDKNFEKICEIIKNNHTYEIPAIIKIDACAESNFYKWFSNIIKI